MQVVTKITTSTLNLNKGAIQTAVKDPADPSKNLPTPVRIAQLFGRADSAELVTSAMGDSYRFNGSFQAINVLTGEEFAARQCFLPRLAEGMVITAMEDEHGNPSRSVEFAFWLMAKGDQPGAKQSAVGYSYSVEPVLNEGVKDPLQRLRLAFSPPSAPDSSKPSQDGPKSGTATDATGAAQASTTKKGK